MSAPSRSFSALIHGPPPWDAILPHMILCDLPKGYSSPSTAPTQLCATGPILQEHTILAWSLMSDRFLQTSSSTVGSYPWVAAWARSLLLQGLSTGFSFLQATALYMCRSALGGVHGLQVDSLLHHGPLHRLQGVSGVPPAIPH